jgi:hypothetical protein
MKEAIEIHERRTGNKLDSFVRLRELIDLGLVTLSGELVTPVESEGGSGEAAAVTLTKGAVWIDPSGAAVATPVNDVFVHVPKAGTIKRVTVLTIGGAGDCVIDVWKDSYANYPPTVADTITAAAKPAISSGVKYQSTTLTGWTVAVSANDVIGFHLESTATFTMVAIFLDIEVSE